MLSKGPKVNLDLTSLPRVFWLNFFAASAGLVTLGASAAGLSSVADRSRRGLLRAPLVWLDRFGDWIHCRSASCTAFLFYYHCSSPESINKYFVQKRVWHFQKGKGGNEENLKLLSCSKLLQKLYQDLQILETELN